MKYRLVFYAALILASCSHRHDARMIVESEVNAEQIGEMDTIPPHSMIYTSPSDSAYMDLMVIDDKFCIIHIANSVQLEILEPDLKKCLYHYDSKDDGLLMPLYTRNGNEILLHDDLVQQTTLIDIHDAYTEPDYHPLRQHSNISSERILSFGDRQAFLNRNSHEPGTPRILFSNRAWNYNKKDKSPFRSPNITHGSLIADLSFSKIGYIPDREPVIELFNRDGKICNRISFYHDKRQSYDDIEINGIREYFYKLPMVTCFSCACAGNEVFAAGFIDDNDNHYVTLLGWDGMFKGGFKTEGEIYNISFSSDERYIYTWEILHDKYYLNRYSNPLFDLHE